MAVAWTVAEAKAKFSKLLDRAAEAGPQVVTRNAADFRDAVTAILDPWASS